MFRNIIINSYILTAELPGFERSNISIDITDNVLSIKAKHTDSIAEKTVTVKLLDVKEAIALIQGVLIYLMLIVRQ